MAAPNPNAEHAAEGGAGESAGHAEGVHITLAPETIWHAGNFPITNGLLTSWIVLAVVIVIAVLTGRRAKMIPSRIQALLEWMFEGVYDFMTTTLESRELARRYFPLLATLFFFIFAANTLQLLPGIGSIVVHTAEGAVPLLRGVNTDLNVTLALAIIAVLAIEVAGVTVLGFFRYAGKFLNFSSPINFVVGLIELVSEVARLVSFSFRLFGNIFAGKVLLAVVVFFVPYVVPVPVMAFEMFVGFIQALVFSLLTLFFIKMAVAEPHGDEHAGARAAH